MKKRIGVLLVLISCMLLFGCASMKKEGQEMYVYYLNADENALIQQEYPVMDIQGAIDKLTAHAVLANETKPEKYVLKGTCLEIYFSGDYLSKNKGTEVLTRAAIVQTMTQIEGVEFVSFYVDGHALVDNDGIVIGMMRAEDFVSNTGSSIDSYQTTDLKLYFADKDGKHLKESKKTSVRYNANTSIERLVVEQLMKGTSASGSQSTIPKSTMLLGVSVKEGTCYVNLDSKFSTDSYDLNPEVAIYSIVNSLIANGNVTQVQILIDGVSNVVYKNSVDLSRPLEWRADLLKE